MDLPFRTDVCRLGQATVCTNLISKYFEGLQILANGVHISPGKDSSCYIKGKNFVSVSTPEGGPVCCCVYYEVCNELPVVGLGVMVGVRGLLAFNVLTHQHTPPLLAWTTRLVGSL